MGFVFSIFALGPWGDGIRPPDERDRRSNDQSYKHVSYHGTFLSDVCLISAV